MPLKNIRFITLALPLVLLVLACNTGPAGTPEGSEVCRQTIEECRKTTDSPTGLMFEAVSRQFFSLFN